MAGIGLMLGIFLSSCGLLPMLYCIVFPSKTVRSNIKIRGEMLCILLEMLATAFVFNLYIFIKACLMSCVVDCNLNVNILLTYI